MNFTQIKQAAVNWLNAEGNYRQSPSEFFIENNFIPVDSSRVWGIDISHWQGAVNLQVAKNNGCNFVIIKACDGSLNTNYYTVNRDKAKSVGLLWGAYMWLYPGNKVSISAQVNTWWARVKDNYPPMGVFIDAEWTTYGGAQANPGSADLRAAIDQFAALSKGKTFNKQVYTSAGYANTWLKGFNYSDINLWAAHYGATVPSLPAGASKYIIHQFTSNLDGVGLIGTTTDSKEVDGNYYNGNKTAFMAEYLNVIVPPEPTGENMKYNITNNSTTSTRTIRKGPGVIFGSVDNLPAGGTAVGDFCYVYDIANTTMQANAGDKWIQVGVNRWLAWIHKGVYYLNVVTVPDVPVVDSIASVFKSEQLVVTHADGRVETFEANNTELKKV